MDELDGWMDGSLLLFTFLEENENQEEKNNPLFVHLLL
jgi:hypothetical protein